MFRPHSEGARTPRRKELGVIAPLFRPHLVLKVSTHSIRAASPERILMCRCSRSPFSSASWRAAACASSAPVAVVHLAWSDAWRESKSGSLSPNAARVQSTPRGSSAAVVLQVGEAPLGQVVQRALQSLSAQAGRQQGEVAVCVSVGAARQVGRYVPRITWGQVPHSEWINFASLRTHASSERTWTKTLTLSPDWSADGSGAAETSKAASNT